MVEQRKAGPADRILLANVSTTHQPDGSTLIHLGTDYYGKCSGLEHYLHRSRQRGTTTFDWYFLLEKMSDVDIHGNVR